MTGTKARPGCGADLLVTYSHDPTVKRSLSCCSKIIWPYGLFISAFMIASKVIFDNIYSNKSWSIIGRGMLQLRDVNRMEREMCQYLDWDVEA